MPTPILFYHLFINIIQNNDNIFFVKKKQNIENVLIKKSHSSPVLQIRHDVIRLYLFQTAVSNRFFGLGPVGSTGGDEGRSTHGPTHKKNDNNVFSIERYT